MLLLAAPVAAATAPVQVEAGIAYGPLAAEQGDFYRPAGAGRAPAVLLIHGGGWVSGSRSVYGALATFIAGQGVAVFAIDYRLADKALPATRWPAQLVDAQLATRYLRAHAAALGIDPLRIGAMGDSAGAQLAVFLGALATVVPGDQAALYPAQSPAVQAVVDQYGPMELAGMGRYGIGSIAALFGTPDAVAAQLLTASPLPAISGRTAPTYILHGRSDEIVPFHDSELLLAALRAHGVAAELVPFDGGHGYEGVAPEAAFRLQTAAISWLARQLGR